MTDLLGWPAVFWSAAALALVAFVAAVKVIPLSTVRAEGRFDGIGARCGCRSGSCSSSSL